MFMSGTARLFKLIQFRFFWLYNWKSILNQSTNMLLKIIGNSHKAHQEGTLRWFSTTRRNLNNQLRNRSNILRWENWNAWTVSRRSEAILQQFRLKNVRWRILLLRFQNVLQRVATCTNFTKNQAWVERRMEMMGTKWPFKFKL